MHTEGGVNVQQSVMVELKEEVDLVPNHVLLMEVKNVMDQLMKTANVALSHVLVCLYTFLFATPFLAR